MSQDKEPHLEQTSIAEHENMTRLRAQYEATRIELETCQKYLQDWHQWSEQRNEEYNVLLKAHNNYEECWKKQTLELSNLKETKNSLQEQFAKVQEMLQQKELVLRDIKNSETQLLE